MNDKLTLYVHPGWRREGIHAPLMNPWWGNPNDAASLFAKELFDSFSYDTTYYTVTDDIHKADIVFAPYRHVWLLTRDPALLAECAAAAREAGLPLLIDGGGDVEYPIDTPNTYVLRIGGYRFIEEKGRIQIPTAADDQLIRMCDGTLQIRKKTARKPVVGFAGWASLPFKQKIRTIAKELPIRLRSVVDSRYRAMYKGVLWRERVIRILKRSPLIELNLKERHSFSGSAKTAEGDLRNLQREMVEVMLESDYCLDVRGDANDSTRLHEILSLGRIPVIVDTERRFPFSDEVCYRDFCLIVDFRDVKNLPRIIAEFHKNISPEQFEDMQRKARDAFVKHFRVDAQTKHIMRTLRKML